MKSKKEVGQIKTQIENEINKLIREGDSHLTAWVKEQILRGKLDVVNNILNE